MTVYVVRFPLLPLFNTVLLIKVETSSRFSLSLNMAVELLVHTKRLLVQMILKNFIQFSGLILIFFVCRVKLQPPAKKLNILLSGGSG